MSFEINIDFDSIIHIALIQSIDRTIIELNIQIVIELIEIAYLPIIV